MTIYSLLGIFFLLIILIYIIQNIYRKLLLHEKFFLSLNLKIANVINKMKALDSRQMFEKDDEVGVIWGELVNILKELEEYLSR
ncbi:MAG: hypothetical protein H8E13_01710 [Actinobacteria bacterium]|nr:hypothetical protein [Actinomycetota bacterium]